jgi:hypothetical protein
MVRLLWSLRKQQNGPVAGSSVIQQHLEAIKPEKDKLQRKNAYFKHIAPDKMHRRLVTSPGGKGLRWVTQHAQRKRTSH